MRSSFLEFLIDEGLIPQDRQNQVRDLLRRAPEPIGAIAFSYGMITGGDVDSILDEQRLSKKPFGEIAVSMGLLTERQVEVLLRVQKMRAATEVAEALMLAGLCPIEQVMAQLGRYLSVATFATHPVFASAPASPSPSSSPSPSPSKKPQRTAA